MMLLLPCLRRYVNITPARLRHAVATNTNVAARTPDAADDADG